MAGPVAAGRLFDFASIPTLPPVQRKEAVSPPAAASGNEERKALPSEVLTRMEGAFGADFSSVRIHQGPRAGSLGAQAYTQGSDIHFAPGLYAPHTQAGQELLGHELAHVVQQAQGRAPATTQARGMPVNDAPELEREADELGAKAARGETLPSTHAAAPPPGTPPIQRKDKDKDKDKPRVPYQIHVDRPMTQEEYKAAAMQQVFGGVIEGLEWSNLNDSYVPAKSPYTLYVDVSLLKRHRGEVNKAKGLDVTAEGGIAGAEARGKKFQAGPATAEKTALMAEIDRRYYAAAGVPAGTKIHSGEKGKAELWFTIRDEVLFQHEYIANLPPKVKELIRFSVKGRVLTPADYDQLFRIARRIEKLPPGQVSDYASKVTGTTTDLNVFEASLDRYITEMTEREKQADARDTLKTKLAGLEEVYKKYREYRRTQLIESVGAGVPGAPISIGPSASGMMRKELETQLQAHRFASISEFEGFIKQFEKAFALEASNITKDVLAKYAGTLYKESERYKDPKEVAALHQKLAGLRAHHAEFEKNAAISNDYAKNSEQARIPGQGHLQPKIGPDEAKAAHGKAAAALEASKAEVQGISGAHPIFEEGALPLDKRIDKAALAKASASDLGGLLQSHIAKRQKDVTEARSHLEGEPELIFKLDKLMPRFYAQQGIAPGSIYDLIIQDKLQDDAIIKLVGGILLAVVAVAIAVVSLGTATPALIAAGASAAGFGLSAYMAYDEYKEYVKQKDLAAVGFADDPSIVWLTLAVLGAALDLGAAVKAMKGLGPAAKALDAGGELSDFAKAVKALEKSGEIDAKIARAADQAAAARKAYGEATQELHKALLGKAYSFPGPFTDPDVYRALVKMAREGLKTKFHDATAFIEELKKLRLQAKLSEMTPEELAKAKEAYEQAKLIQKSATEPVEIIGESGRPIGRFSNGSHLELIPSKSKDVLHGGNIIKLDPNATTTITGTLADTNKVATRGARLPGSTLMGENPGGINILRSPKWAEIQTKHKALLDAGDELKYWKTVTDEFWQTVNKPWLDEAIARGDKFRFVSDPASEGAIYVTKKTGEFILDNGQKIKSIFGREIDYLKSKGYVFQPDGTAVKVM